MIKTIDPKLQQYMIDLVPERPEELRLMEGRADRDGFPIIGPAAGHLCYLVARMINARRVFELGSGFGYSTAWFARAVKENGGGSVSHVVWDEGLSERARGHLTELGLTEQVSFHVGEAVQALGDAEGPFDLIFNDIDKEAYPHSLGVIGEKLRAGGVLLIDNMIWDGKVLDSVDQGPDTAGIRRATTILTEGSDWISSLIPIRDGLIMAMKRD